MLDRFRPRREIPLAAKRRAWIMAVAHLGHQMEDRYIQRIMGKWVAHGDLSQAEWDIIEELAKTGMNKYKD